MKTVNLYKLTSLAIIAVCTSCITSCAVVKTPAGKKRVVIVENGVNFSPSIRF